MVWLRYQNSAEWEVEGKHFWSGSVALVFLKDSFNKKQWVQTNNLDTWIEMKLRLQGHKSGCFQESCPMHEVRRVSYLEKRLGRNCLLTAGPGCPM
jgi:hypothetical protein